MLIQWFFFFHNDDDLLCEMTKNYAALTITA